MILFIDNYDSFVHNLARYFERLKQRVRVVRNDQITIDEIQRLAPQAIVISPGPCGPAQAGISMAVVQHFDDSIPILGVCLGHQVIAEAFGGQIARAGQPMHGRASEITHDGTSIFQDIPNPFSVCRYHSLIVDRASLPDCMRVTAETLDGTLMAFEHRSQPVIGVQFHPEAILTQHGYDLLANFLRLSSISIPLEANGEIPARDSELCLPPGLTTESYAAHTIWNPQAKQERATGGEN